MDHVNIVYNKWISLQSITSLSEIYNELCTLQPKSWWLQGTYARSLLKYQFWQHLGHVLVVINKKYTIQNYFYLFINM